MDAALSLERFLKERNLSGVRLVGHSYGGMVISQLMNLAPERVTRLVYVNAFVPNPGESLNDMVPPLYVEMFDQIAAASNGAVVLPFPIWREAFINDADLALATSAYEKLNPHPYNTFTDKVVLKEPLAACRSARATSTAGSTSLCRTACRGIPAFPRSWACIA